MRKAFFSVSGEDQPIAEKLAKNFRPDLMYLYSHTGEIGAEIWKEVEEKLRECHLFVIFWSKHYVSKPGTIREILRASELLRQNVIKGVLIIRLDETPLDEKSPDPTDGKSKTLLSPFSNKFRALELPFDFKQAEALLDQQLLNLDESAPPILPRPFLDAGLDKAFKIDHRRTHPVVWVSGREGYGRRSLIHRVMKNYLPNSVGIEIELVDVDTSQQLLLRIYSLALNAPESDLEQLAVLSPEEQISEIEKALNELANRKRFLIIKIDRISPEGRSVQPWLANVLCNLKNLTWPYVFIVAPFPADNDLRKTLGDKFCDYTVEPLSHEEATDLCNRLLSHFDQNPQRWTDEHCRRVVAAAGGTPSLLVSIVRAVCLAPSLSWLDSISDAQQENFTAKLDAFILTALQQIPQDGQPERKILRLLIDLRLLDYFTLLELFEGNETSIVSPIETLANLGLIEHFDDNLFRVPHLIARRLRSLLISEVLNSFANRAMQHFARKTEKHIDASHGYIRIEAKINSSLKSGIVPPENLKKFVTAAHLFMAGLAQYRNRRFNSALALLRNTYEHRDELGEYSQIEVCRYYGLCAVREQKKNDEQRATETLRNFKNTKFGAPAMADFIAGYQARLDHNFDEALKCFERCLAGTPARNYQRLSAVHREIALVIRNSNSPNYQKALEHARTALKLHDNFVSSDCLLRCLVWSRYLGPHSSEQQEILDRDIDLNLARLENLNGSPETADLYFVRKSELEEAKGNLTGALEFARKAVMGTHIREEAKVRLWQMLDHIDSQSNAPELESLTRQELNKMGRNIRQSSIAGRFLVRSLMWQGKWKDAWDAFNKYKNVFPQRIQSELLFYLPKKTIEQSNSDFTLVNI